MSAPGSQVVKYTVRQSLRESPSSTLEAYDEDELAALWHRGRAIAVQVRDDWGASLATAARDSTFRASCVSVNVGRGRRFRARCTRRRATRPTGSSELGRAVGDETAAVNDRARPQLAVATADASAPRARLADLARARPCCSTTAASSPGATARLLFAKLPFFAGIGGSTPSGCSQTQFAPRARTPRRRCDTCCRDAALKREAAGLRSGGARSGCRTATFRRARCSSGSSSTCSTIRTASTRYRHRPLLRQRPARRRCGSRQLGHPRAPRGPPRAVEVLLPSSATTSADGGSSPFETLPEAVDTVATTARARWRRTARSVLAAARSGTRLRLATRRFDECGALRA